MLEYGCSGEESVRAQGPGAAGRMGSSRCLLDRLGSCKLQERTVKDGRRVGGKEGGRREGGKEGKEKRA